MANPLPRLAAMPPPVEYEEERKTLCVPGAENGEVESMPALFFVEGEPLMLTPLM
jgi:hypothetical protein